MSDVLPGSLENIMNVCELEIGSDLYNEAIELRYELFFRRHDLPRDILIDEHEKGSKHIALVDNKSLIAYGRLTDLGGNIYQLSQIVVQPHEQGKGYGSMIITELIRLAEASKCIKIILNARTAAPVVYKKHGFRECGDVFLSKSTTLPHVQMFYMPNYK